MYSPGFSSFLNAPQHSSSSPTPKNGFTTTYVYDEVGNLKRVSYPNGTVADYSYDRLNRLVELVNKTSTGGIISSYAYTLDAAGNRTKVEEHSGRIVEYDYDEMHKLVTETISHPVDGTRVISYTYDAVGNRLSKTDCTEAPQCVSTDYTYDDNNRLIQAGNITYRYDNNGNLIEQDSLDEEVSYHYDVENRLIRAETTAHGSTIVVKYAYDAQGNRIRKSIDGLVTINYLVDENRNYAQVLEERDTNGDLLVRYVYGHDLISQVRGGAVSYYHYDGLGSTRALTNIAEAVTDTYTYDAFGNLFDKTGTTPNNYLYTGEQLDANLGFYYLRARYMNPEIGRFVTMDEFAGRNRDPYSLHKYLYAHANPVVGIDPSGYMLDTVSTTGAAKIRGILSKISANPMLRLGVKIGLQISIQWGIRAGLAYLEFQKIKITLGDIARQAIEELIEERGGSSRTLYRGLSGKDMDELEDYNLIYSWALRAPKSLMEERVYLEEEVEWTADWMIEHADDIKEALKEEMESTLDSNYALRMWPEKHVVGEGFGSPLISLSGTLKWAKSCAKQGNDPSFYVAYVQTRRATQRGGSHYDEYNVLLLLLGYGGEIIPPLEYVGD